MPRAVLRPTAAYFGAMVALGMVLASLGPTIPGLAAQTSTSLSGVSAVFVTRSLGYLAGSLLLGRLFDRLPGHWLMGCLLVWVAGMMALVPLAQTILLLVGLLLLLGCAEGCLDVGATALLVRLHPRNFGPWMNGLHLCFGIGALISPLLIARAFLIDGTIDWAYWILAAMVLPVAVWNARVPAPPIPARRERADSAGSRGDRTTIALVAALLFAVVSVEIGFGNWIYTYSLESGLAEQATAAYLTSAFWSAFTFGRLVGIPIAARFGPGPIFAADAIGCSVAAGLLLLLPDSGTALWCATILAGLASASMFAAVIALAGTRLEITGRVTGWFFVGSSVSSMAIPWIIGQFFESVGPQVMPWIVLATLAAGLGVYLLFRSVKPPR